jgi:hypothetical protein
MSSTDFQQWHVSSFLPYPFVRPLAEPSLRPDPQSLMPAARRGESRMAVAQVVQLRVGTSRPLLDGPEHGGRLGLVGFGCFDYLGLQPRPSYRGTTHEAEPASCGLSLPHPYMRWDPTADPHHDAIYASAARLRSSGAHSCIRHESHRTWRATATSGRFLADRRSEAPVRPKTDDPFLLSIWVMSLI